MGNDFAPSARSGHTAVWATGLSLGPVTRAMIVWGGVGSPLPGRAADGAIFDPIGNKWVSSVDASGPSARTDHVAVWDSLNGRMNVGAGYGTVGTADSPMSDYFSFTPPQGATPGAWAPIKASGPPSARRLATAVWNPAGGTMVVFGGTTNGAAFPADGASFNGQTWTSLPGTAPEGRTGHTAVWLSGAKGMVVFGGDRGTGKLLSSAFSLDGTGFRPLPTAPTARTHHAAVAAGSALIIWGGLTDLTASSPIYTNTGAVFDASP